MTRTNTPPNVASYMQVCQNLKKAIKAVNMTPERVTILFTGSNANKKTEHSIFEFRKDEIPGYELKEFFQTYGSILFLKKMEFESFTFTIEVKYNDTISNFDLQQFLKLSYGEDFSALTNQEIREIENILSLSQNEEIAIRPNHIMRTSNVTIANSDEILYIKRID